ERVHERHAEDGGRAEVGPHVQHGAEQEAARAPALDHEPIVRGEPWRTRSSAHAMKSVNVLRFLRSRPSSCQRFPSSPPPRTWATATATPRSRRLKRFDEKVTGYGIPYAP